MGQGNFTVRARGRSKGRGQAKGRGRDNVRGKWAGAGTEPEP